MQTSEFRFKPDIRSFGAIRRMNIKLRNGYTYDFSDVFDFDEEPFIGLDMYNRAGMPVGYVCVINGQYLKRITFNRETDEICVEGHLGKEVRIVFTGDEDKINIVDTQ